MLSLRSGDTSLWSSSVKQVTFGEVEHHRQPNPVLAGEAGSSSDLFALWNL